MKAPGIDPFLSDTRNTAKSQRGLSTTADAWERLSAEERAALRRLQRGWQRLALQFVRTSASKKGRCIGVTSALRGEGRTTAAIGFATALAIETGDNVLLAELDWESPTLAADFDVMPAPGLVDFLYEQCEWDATLRPTHLDNLTLAPFGGGRRPGAGGYASARDSADIPHYRLPTVFKRMRQDYAVTVLDLPPVLSNSLHTEAVVQGLDGSLLVVRGGATPLRHVRDAIQWIGETKLEGVVHIGPPSAIPRWLSELVLN